MEDIVCLLQDLGKENAVEVISNFIIRNPETEDLIAAKMGSILATPEVGSSATNPTTSAPVQDVTTNRNSMPFLPFLTPSSIMSFVQGRTRKMVFVVNMGLNMGRGKQCAQVAHAALGLYLLMQERGNPAEKSECLEWINEGQKKIVVKGKDLKHLLKIQEDAIRGRLPNYLVSDAGCTQIAPGSKTVLAIFGDNEQLESITGSLKLL